MKKRSFPIQGILRVYKKMSGDKKIKLAMELSSMVRKVRQDGKTYTGA